MPVIMAGIRTSAVWVIGTATLSTPIGQTSLGNYIFAGLQTQNWVFVAFGCVAAAALALLVDQLLALMEHGAESHSRARRRRRPRPCAGGVGGAAARPRRRPQALTSSARSRSPSNTCSPRWSSSASKRRAFRRSGATNSVRQSSSTRSRPATSMSMSIIPARSGPTKCTAPIRPAARGRAGVRGGLAAADPGVPMLGVLGFENAYALAMPREKATPRHLFDRGSRRPRGAAYDCRRLRIFRTSGMESASISLWPEFRQQRTMQSGFHVPGRCRWRRRYSVGLFERRPHRQIRPQGARRPEHAIPPYDAILLIAPSAPTTTRSRPRCSPWPAPSTLTHARSQSARFDQRRDAGRGGALAGK